MSGISTKKTRHAGECLVNTSISKHFWYRDHLHLGNSERIRCIRASILKNKLQRFSGINIRCQQFHFQVCPLSVDSEFNGFGSTLPSGVFSSTNESERGNFERNFHFYPCVVRYELIDGKKISWKGFDEHISRVLLKGQLHLSFLKVSLHLLSTNRGNAHSLSVASTIESYSSSQSKICVAAGLFHVKSVALVTKVMYLRKGQSLSKFCKAVEPLMVPFMSSMGIALGHPA